jgi:O-antigen/teichoic acid export membrane protein
MVLLAYSTAIPISFFSEWIIQTLYGDAYQGSIPMLAVLAWSSLFINLGIARNIFLTTLNWMKLYFMTVFLGCLLNISLNYLLIPQYGGMGAAIATLIAYWFAIHGACFFYKPLIKTGQMMTKAIFLQGFFS